MNNELINELYNKLDAQEDIIKTLEIQLAELKKKKCKNVLGDCLFEEIEGLREDKQRALQYIKNFEESNQPIEYFDLEELKEILGEEDKIDK